MALHMKKKTKMCRYLTLLRHKPLNLKNNEEENGLKCILDIYMMQNVKSHVKSQII